MICPYCGIGIILNTKATDDSWADDGTSLSLDGVDKGSRIGYGHCPNCNKLIVLLQQGSVSPSKWEYSEPGDMDFEVENEEIIYPHLDISITVAPEVPERYKQDFTQAALTLPISPKASAALSRRILQDVIHEQFKIEKRSLDKEIEEFINLPATPTSLAEEVDAVRIVGNFAAHPSKDTNTGEIVDVESGEAEWLLDVLDALFDFAFVQPKRLEERKNNLNQKLQSLGKPPMK